MKEELKIQFQRWYVHDEDQKIADTILDMPEEERDYETFGWLAVAYNNTNRYKDAIEVLKGISEEGKEDGAWYYKYGYALYSLKEYETAHTFFQTALFRHQEKTKEEDETSVRYNNWIEKCEKAISKEQKQLIEFKEEPIKIVYSQEKAEFEVVEGVVELGFFGKYTTKDMSINGKPDWLLNSVLSSDESNETDMLMYVPIKPYLRENMTNEEIAEGLSNYYNDRLADMKKHITEINQTFLAYILGEMCDCELPVWEECTDYIDEAFLQQYDEDEYLENFYTDDALKASEELFNKYYEADHDSEVINDTISEDIFGKYFPMFDWKKMLKDVKAEYLTFDNASICLQCDGEGQAGELVCGAYAEVTAKNALYDWHNF